VDHISPQPTPNAGRGGNDKEDRKGKAVVGNMYDKGKDDCFKFGGWGHYAVVCPTRDQKFTLMCGDTAPKLVDQQPPSEKSYSDEEVVEEVLEGSQLPMCVIRHTLTGKQTEEREQEDWLRNNIFHTRVEHKGKALNLIIDNGSGMNVVSQEVIRKMQLPIEAHPIPYKLSWVDDTSIPMRQRCLVTFSLGQHYQDAIWCDVIPMTACHVLLGRPWLYDRKVKYDGYTNTYSFLFNGRKIVLQPLRIQEFDPPKKESHEGFLSSLSGSRTCFVLVSKPTQPTEDAE